MMISFWLRVLGVLLYLLPWSDAIPFGRHLFLQFSFLQWLAIPALPLIFFEQTIPFGGLIIFFVLFLTIVRNPKIPYFIRFNTLQALLIDIGLILISYGFQLLIVPIGGGLIVRTLSSTVFLATLVMISFSAIECIQGNEPDLPGISEAVRIQL